MILTLTAPSGTRSVVDVTGWGHETLLNAITALVKEGYVIGRAS